MDELGVVLRSARPQALATLTRLLGDVDFAEDVLQEACARAVSAWRDGHVPDLPAAWLVRSARNYAIDLHRKDALGERHRDRLQGVFDGDADRWRRIEVDACEPVRDDLLRLLFTCCHPELPDEARIALTLKAIGGLSVAEIATAFLVSPDAMEQRITRAKRRIRERRIPYQSPSEADLPERLDSVCAVVYLIFNEGYKSAQGPEVRRDRLAAEAVRLGRVVASLFRNEPEVSGLLALMLLQHARRSARVAPDGDVVLLEDQDRTRWDREAIAEGRALVDRALRRGSPGPYQIQAAIAGVHAAARSFEDTDWAEIAALYRLLEIHDRSPVVRLNRAVAVARVDGASAGLSLITSIAGLPQMARYPYFHAVRAQLLAESGETRAAQAAYQDALSCTTNERERAALERRLRDFDVA